MSNRTYKVMARREWAEREAEKLCKKHQYFSEPAIALAFKTEHARTVRIVKRIGTKKCPDWLPMNHYDDGYIMACEDILAALQKGRA